MTKQYSLYTTVGVKDNIGLVPSWLSLSAHGKMYVPLGGKIN